MGKSKAELYQLYLNYLDEPTDITIAEASRRSGASESSIRRWRRGISIPPEPAVMIECSNKDYNRQRTILRNQARKLADKHTNRFEHSFSEIAIMMNLTATQVKIIYLNAIRKIKIGLDRKGIDIGYIPETIEDLVSFR
jgi:hypothetical protein